MLNKKTKPLVPRQRAVLLDVGSFQRILGNPFGRFVQFCVAFLGVGFVAGHANPENDADASMN
eukprot:2736214-Amphidinium_carterae.1